MKQKWLRIFALPMSLFLCLSGFFSTVAHAYPEQAVPILEESNAPIADFGVEEGSLKLPCKSAVLMEANTGTVLYRQNAEEALPPASVTKIMTLLLVMEAIDADTVRLDDTVTASANAASMGGSQVYLKEGEQMTLEDMLKSVVIASANDAAVALAEHISGSVTAFVDKMNRRAAELGMKNTTFENVTGLDDSAEHHMTSAMDIALMSRELVKHRTILQYSSIWMDTIRDGAFGLTNTNRLVRFYSGCTGLKTGSTSKAGFCVSATAERGEMSLICVIMGAESRDVRNATATQLLDWGFANYGLYRAEPEQLAPIEVIGGVQNECEIATGNFCAVLPKSSLAAVQSKIELPASIGAPVKAGDVIGSIVFTVNDTPIGSLPIVATETVNRINFFDVWLRMIARFLLI